MFTISIAILSILMLGVTLAPLLPSNHWICRVWEFPRVQIAVITAGTLVGSFFVASPVLQIALLLSNGAVVVYQLLWILPYTRLYPVQVAKAEIGPNSTTVKILTSNVLMPNRGAHKLMALVKEHQPDVIVTLETDSWWENALRPIHADYPHRVNQALDNLYGMHVYSKYVLEDVKVLNMIEEGVPSVHCYLILNNGAKVKCHFLHPAPPSPTENTTSTPRDRELLLIAKEVASKTQQEPIIVTGDLNDVAWSPTTRAFRRISGLQDPRIGRGMFNTFHADYALVRWPLDHIFHTEHFKLSSIQRMPSIGSDHFALLSELVYVDRTY